MTKIRYKKDKENITNTLQIYAFKEIMENVYLGEIEKEDQRLFIEKLTKQNNPTNTIIIIELKPKIYKNIIQIGTSIELKEEKYKIL